MNLKFHHVGIAVNSIPDSALIYEALGYKVSEPVYDPVQNVWLASCMLNDQMVELVAPHDESSPCTPVLRKSGAGPYHICYQCESIEDTKIALKKSGVRFVVISPIKPTTLFENAHVTFLYITKIGLVELISYSDPEA